MAPKEEEERRLTLSAPSEVYSSSPAMAIASMTTALKTACESRKVSLASEDYAKLLDLCTAAGKICESAVTALEAVSAKDTLPQAELAELSAACRRCVARAEAFNHLVRPSPSPDLKSLQDSNNVSKSHQQLQQHRANAANL